MSILIRGMEMPETCDDCPFPYVSASYDKYMECPLSKYEPTALKRNDDCPLIEVPPHGRLIDADTLLKHEVLLPRDGGSIPVLYASYVRNVPTIIEAEKEAET